ncbi:hypothetical protein K32_34720 [Kaistia sp. 32K]|nr:hypothetical protein K32_34720 [Kaistia sp. 32K]
MTGADLRNWQNASAAAGLGEVLLVSLIAGGEGPTSVPNLATRHLGADAAKLYQLDPQQTSIDLGIDDAMLGKLAKVLAEFRPDLVVVEHLGLHPFLDLLQESGARLVLDLHNVESDLANQIARRRDWFGVKRRRDARAIAAIEARVAAAVDGIWACSEEDAGRLAERGLGPAHVVPNGLPRADLAPRQLPAEPGAVGPELLFVGHLGYTPNVRASETLARKILPKLRSALPEVRLTLAGRQPARRVRRLAAPDIRIVANPDDLTPLLRAAHMAVVPLRSGGGTRFKIVEAMAWGLPVVATPLAAEGLGLRHGHDIILAESDRALAAEILRLWRDRTLREELRARGHATAWRRFGPDPIQDAVVSALKAVSQT